VKEDTTRVQRFFNRLQNHPILAFILIICIVIISLGTFTDSVDKLVSFAKKHLPEKPPKQQELLETRVSKPVKEEQKESPVAIDNAAVKVPQHEREKDEELPKEKLLPATDKSLVPPTAAVFLTEIRSSVKAAATALRGETTSDRVRSVGTLLPNLPDDLNAKEIALLAGSETTIHREQILYLLVKRTKPNSLNPADIPKVLGTETTSNRVMCIRIVSPYIKGPISGKEAAAILASETFSHRVQCLRPIASKLDRPLIDSEVQNILRGTSTSDRTEAIELLFGKGESKQ